MNGERRVKRRRKTEEVQIKLRTASRMSKEKARRRTNGTDLLLSNGPVLERSKKRERTQHILHPTMAKDIRMVTNHTYTSIDEADQLTPDNWTLRSLELIQLVGKHPLNVYAPVSRIFESGFTTPNELHYVRSHAAVPRLVWETHLHEIVTYDCKRTKLSMNDLKKNSPALNLPIFMACDDGRRREMKIIKQAKDFNWGPETVGCAYWKGPLLHNVLLATGVPGGMHDQDTQRYFVAFRGADEPNEHYKTSILYECIMDEYNNVLLGDEMNDVPLPPDHGYPVRVGYTGECRREECQVVGQDLD